MKKPRLLLKFKVCRQRIRETHLIFSSAFCVAVNIPEHRKAIGKLDAQIVRLLDGRRRHDADRACERRETAVAKCAFPARRHLCKWKLRNRRNVIIFQAVAGIRRRKTSLATLPGIEPGLPSRKADTQKHLYYQHNQTHLT
jgi:hypothetical protein